MGRTARQGQQGTYELVLAMQDLRANGINALALQSLNQQKQYEALATARMMARGALQEKVDQQLQKATEVDMLTHSFFDAVVAGRTAEAKERFTAFYKHVKRGNCCKPLQRARLVCLSDATGSMAGIWERTKADISTMIQRIEQIGGENFEILWIAYRDYSDSKLIERSPWTSNAQSLKSFVSSIVCDGGGDGEEAVERALLEARREHDRSPVTRVLLIADAPPHFERKGQKLSCHNHVLETDYMTEARELKSRGVPVFCFRVGSCSTTLSRFQEIAETTQGEVADLTAAKLIDVICISTLEDIGGGELVAEYRALYGG